MSLRSTLEFVASAALVLFVVAMLLGQLLGQPVLLGYVTSDSMEPTISQGDGYVAVPSFVMGEPRPGDIVVFNARELHDGGLTTHRIVDETGSGYVTKGDNNPFTDQDGGEPPVTEGQIVAYVPQVNGGPIVIPELGTAITGVQSTVTALLPDLGEGRSGPLLVGLGIVLFLLAGLTGDRGQRSVRRSRARENVVAIWMVVLLVALVVMAAATAAMVLPAGVFEFGVVTAEQPTSEPFVVEPNAVAELTYETHNAGFLPMLVMVDRASVGTSIEPDRTILAGGERAEMTVRITAPDETGTYVKHVQESRYLLVLPPSILTTLHDLHPLVALLAVNAVVGGLVVSASVAVFGTGHLRLRPGTSVPASVRARRRLRKLLG